ncbi:MAG: cohesin domain-containing protein [Candidatus Cloacimonetes bacterium]|nr:cohesin domain-containing protein [Candidatus Cloacimonadota bacterium]
MLRNVFNPELCGKRILLLIVFAIMIFSISCSSSVTTEPDVENLKLMFSPAEQTVPANTEADYVIQVENADNLFAFSAEIVFDNSVAELVQDAVVIGGFWNTDLLELSIVEDDRLSITISLQQTSNEDGIDGNGDLFTLSIEGITIGESDLTFENLQMIDENGYTVPNFDEIEIISGKLIVE